MRLILWLIAIVGQMAVVVLLVLFALAVGIAFAAAVLPVVVDLLLPTAMLS